jgi:amino acid transporter
MMLVAVVLNLMRVSVTALLNTVSAYWHMVGVAVIVLVLIVVPDQHKSLGYVFGHTINNSGFSGHNFGAFMFWYVFGQGLLMAQYTITGFDASAHTAEETNKASRGAAVGMWTSVFVSVVFGFVLLVAVTFAIPSTDGALTTVNKLLPIVPWIWATSMSQRWAEFLLFICVVAQFFCVTASVTSASRMMFAFSRDRAVPGHQLWRRIARNRVPVYSVIGVSLFAAILMVPAVWNYFIGYAVGTAIAVIGLYIAFILPVYLRWRKGDSWDAPRAWSLGRHYKWLDPISIVWVGIVSILFIFPLYKVGLPWVADFDWQFTNYTVIWFGAIGLIFGGWWLLSARRWFKGPVRMSDEEVAARERAAEGGEPGLAPAGR